MIIFKKNLIGLFFILMALSSCSNKIHDFLPERPDSVFDFGEDVSPEFKQGWADGCEVGMKSGSNTFYQMFYRTNKVDGFKMTSSSDYKTAWGNAFWFCYRDDYVRQKSSIWGSTFNGHY